MKSQPLTKSLSKVYNSCKIGVSPFFCLKIDEDDDIKQKYLLMNNLINKSSKIIN